MKVLKNGLFMVLVVTMVGLQLLDVTSTYAALTIGASETNQLVDNIPDPFLLLFVKIMVGFGFAFVAAHFIDVGKSNEGFMLAIGYITIYTFIIASNIFMTVIAFHRG